MLAAVMRCRRRRSPSQPHGSTRRASPGRGTQPEPLQRAQVAVAAVDDFTCVRVYHRPPRYNSVPRVMSSPIIEYLSARPDSATFLTPLHYAQTLEDLFPRSESLLPQPYNIFPADETQPPVLGFPLTETPIIKELDAKLDRWLTDEVTWQVTRKPDTKEKAQLSLTGYLTQVLKVSENAMMSNLLNDYHAVFW